MKDVIGALEEDGVRDDMIGLREGLYSVFHFFFIFMCATLRPLFEELNSPILFTQLCALFDNQLLLHVLIHASLCAFANEQLW